MVKATVLENPLGVKLVLKLNRLMGMTHQSKNLFKNQTFNGDKTSYLLFKKKKELCTC